MMRAILGLCGCVMMAGSSLSAAPLPTTFTYQGQLKDGGVPADGAYDMRFSLFNAASGGSAVAGPLVFDGGSGNGAPVDVLGGLFSVVLDFGPVYDGTALWLHVEVRLHGVGGYIALTPRQPLTAAPFALYALDGPGQAGFWQASGASIYKTNTGNVGIGTSSPQRILHTVGNAVLFERAANDAAVLLRNTLNGTLNAAFGLTNTGANDGYAYLSDQTQTKVLHVRSGQVGIGTNDPASTLHLHHPGSSTGDIHFGSPAGAPGIAGFANNGNRRDIRFSDTGLGLYARNSASMPIAGNGLFIEESGNVGIGTTAPNAELHVLGDGVQSVARITNGGSCGGMTNTGLLVSDVCGAGRAAAFYGVTSNTLVTIQNDGSGKAATFVGDVAFNAGLVGIGNSNPAVKLHVDGGSDASLGGGGFAVLGPVNGQNMAIDNNEIMARNNGSPATLFLNHDGGSVVIGGNAPNARVGLGTSLPTERLDLGGGNIAMGYQIVTTLGVGSNYLAAICPAGQVVLGGGCNCGTGDTLSRSEPGLGTQMGNPVYWWECVCANGTVSAKAICANMR